MVWILRYLAITADYGLLYGKKTEENTRVIGNVDSNYASDMDKKTSLIGYLFSVNSCTVNWKATLQNVVALSITEAQYNAVVEVVKEALWLKRMVSE